MNLIPEESGTAPNYWCTWSVQNYMYGQGDEGFDPKELVGFTGAKHARNNLNEELLAGKNGWAESFFSKIRNDLFIVLDDGWDVPVNTPPESNEYFSSFHLNEGKFPSCKGIPPERLKKLSEIVKKHGWRGIGLWVAAQEATKYKAKDDPKSETYWKERIEWSKQAGILYWKVDWGRKMSRNAFRRFLTSQAREMCPDLTIEHAGIDVPLNNYNSAGEITPISIRKRIKTLEFSDVLRLYDVTPPLSIPTTLDRLAQVLKKAKPSGVGKSLVNCEDEVYLAATLGCTMGIMRYPLSGLRPAEDLDFFDIGTRQVKKRMDEVIRAVRWHRIAPPFGIGRSIIHVDDNNLYDSWNFREGETWHAEAIDKTVIQKAPARVSRGIKLPLVDIKGEPPYVVACKNPNGAISIATLARTSPEKGYFHPKAGVSLDINNISGPIGIFGYYKELSLHINDLTAVNSIWAQDIAGNEAFEISNEIQILKDKLIIPGVIIENYGLKTSSKNDCSDPGVIIALLS